MIEKEQDELTECPLCSTALTVNLARLECPNCHWADSPEVVADDTDLDYVYEE
jgi:Zn finger protein HypA/HybF involved in hydrogenase expression